jgi:hypothetical protein
LAATVCREIPKRLVANDSQLILTANDSHDNAHCAIAQLPNFNDGVSHHFRTESLLSIDNTPVRRDLRNLSIRGLIANR